MGGRGGSGIERLEKLAASSGAGSRPTLKKALRYLQRHSLVIIAMVLVLVGLSMSHGFHDLLPSNRPHAGAHKDGIQGAVHSPSVSSLGDSADPDDGLGRDDEHPVDESLALDGEEEGASPVPTEASRHRAPDPHKPHVGGQAKGVPRGDHQKASHVQGAKHHEATRGGGGGDTKAAGVVRKEAEGGNRAWGSDGQVEHQVAQQHHAEPLPADGGAGLPCGKHGTLTRSTCLCSVLFSGPKCEVPFKFPTDILPVSMTNWTANFGGEMVINRKAMKYRENLSVHLPGKEQDPDHGYRVLAEGAILDKLLKLVPEDDVLSEKVYKSCAIVGSSGIVLNYDHGADIDQHEMVWRFNSAPTKGYENHVGSKTTHRITNTQNWGFQESASENILIHFRATSAVKGIFWNAAQKKPIKLYAFDPTFVEYMAFGLDFMATSGLYGIMIALQRCAKVDLYGFQVSTAHGALYHYYDVCDVPANTGRDDSEYTVVKAIVEAGLAKFAEPCIIECHNSAEECDKCKEDSDFRVVSLPSDKKCDPNRVSRGHMEVPWRRNRGKHRGGR